jgi:hypothetical protein
MSQLEKTTAEKRTLGQNICQVLEAEISKLALDAPLPAPDWDNAQFRLLQDPALGLESLEALWLGSNGAKLGSAILHPDGSFFAEYDIIRPHPAKPKWFVEAVTAWGRNGEIKSEARLLPMPE